MAVRPLRVVGSLLAAAAVSASTVPAEGAPAPGPLPGTVILTQAASALPAHAILQSYSDAGAVFVPPDGSDQLTVARPDGTRVRLGRDGQVQWSVGSAIVWFDASYVFRWYDTATGVVAPVDPRWRAISPTGGLFVVPSSAGPVLRNQNAVTGAITDVGPVRRNGRILGGTAGAAVVVANSGSPSQTTVDYVPYDGGATVAVDLTGLSRKELADLSCLRPAGDSVVCNGDHRIIRLRTDGAAPSFLPVTVTSQQYLASTATTIGWVVESRQGPSTVYNLVTVPVAGGTPVTGPRTAFELVASDTGFAYSGGSSSADAGVYRTPDSASTPSRVVTLGASDYGAGGVGVSPGRVVWPDNARTDLPLWQRTVTGPGTVAPGRTAIGTGSTYGVLLSGNRTVQGQLVSPTVFSPVLPSQTIDGAVHVIDGNWLVYSPPNDWEVIRDLRTGAEIDTNARFGANGNGSVSASRFTFLKDDASVWQVGLDSSDEPVQLLPARGPEYADEAGYSHVAAWGDWVVASQWDDHTGAFHNSIVNTRTGSVRAAPAGIVVGASAAGWMSAVPDDNQQVYPESPYTLHSWNGNHAATFPSPTPPGVAGGSIGWVGNDGRPRLAPVPWEVVDRPRYLGSALAPATVAAGQTWTFDAPTSARLTTCTVRISQGATLVRSLTCDAASAADGDALVRWDGTDASGSPVAAGNYTWTVAGSNSDGTLLAANGSTAPVSGTVRVTA